MATAKPKSCICDSIYGISGDRCEASTQYLCRYKAIDFSSPEFRYNGDEINAASAIGIAHDILVKASYPLITGIECLGVKSQQNAVNIARSTGAVIDAGFDAANHGSTMSLAREGAVTASLGEFMDRSQMVLVVGCDPMATHPRIFGRLNNDNRKIVVIGSQSNSATAQAADSFFLVPDDDLESALVTIESLVRGTRVNQDVESLSNANWMSVVDQIVRLEYVAVLFGSEVGLDSEFSSITDTMISIIKALNNQTRVVMLNLRSDKNGLGAENVLTWSTGFPQAVDLSRVLPTSFGCEFSALRILKREECDAVMFFGNEPASNGLLCDKARNYLSTIPQIQFKWGQQFETVSNFTSATKILEICNLNPFADDFVRIDDAMFGVAPAGIDENKGILVQEFLASLLGSTFALLSGKNRL